MMIDMHCHVDLYPDPELFASKIAESGMYVLAVTTTPKAWPKTKSLLACFKRIRPALGLHPQLAHDRFPEMSLFEELLPQTRYVGEVGLDGSPEFMIHAEVQLKVFRRVICLCEAAGGRILSIHSRGAATAVLDCIEERAGLGFPILHWFSGSQGELRRAIQLGCWFSVGPVMFRSERGRSIIRELPKGRVLTETDGPFGKIRGKALTPMEVSLAVEGLAGLWSEPVKEVSHQLYANFKMLVNAGCGNGSAEHV